MSISLLLMVSLFVPVFLCRRAEAASADEAVADWIDRNKDAMLKEWLEVMAIPGKSRQEQKRTAWFEAKFRKIGLEDVTRDEIGNVWGTMKGKPGARTLLITGHMDSVFANDVPLNPEIRDGWIYCPGAGDDIPAPLALTWIKRALDELSITPACNLLFLATVQEEVGLQGMKYYLAHAAKKPDQVIAVDGQLGKIFVGGLGVNWYKVYAVTPAGHTMKSLGQPSAVKSLALAITEAYKYQTEEDPPIYLNLGVIGGGTTENAICEEAWVTLDMRCPDPAGLKKLEDSVLSAMEKAITDSGAVFRKELLMDITAGQQPNPAGLDVVQAAVVALKDLGYDDVPLSGEGATDGNVSVSLGIPTVSVGVISSENAHSLQERARVDSFATGMKQLMMMVTRLK
ncbi:MAG: M20/M25/M40 family metallo-hydrolase [Synergistaceae bacterium]|nr:M20/M25/M40 family metallo-hydrolase [Synergistaceae bacterium]